MEKIYTYSKVYDCYSSDMVPIHIPFVIKISKHEWGKKNMSEPMYKHIENIIEHAIINNVYQCSLDKIYYNKFRLQYNIYVDINYELSELHMDYYVVDIYTDGEITDDANYFKNIESYFKNRIG